MISLRQLRYFNALAHARHFGRAAEACSVTQPALSMQIKELEEALGLALVERRKSGVRLTGEGREIAERAGQILLDVQALQDFAANRAGPLGRLLSLGVIPTIAPYFLPAVLPQLQERYPELDLTLHEAQTASLLSALTEGTLDVALLALPAGDERFESLALFEDTFRLAMPAGAEAPDGLSTQDLRADSLILLEEGHCLRDQALAACGSVAPRTMSKFGATSLTTVLQMVAGGYGSTLIPEMAVPSEVSGNDRLQLLRFRDPQPARTVGLLWRVTAPRKDQYCHLGAVLAEIWQAARASAAE
jgi:LysR family hydrogen peroxide-inducible transcriptional activator